MATRELRSPTGEVVEATVVPIKEIQDPPIIITLEDGSVIRLKVDVIEVCRADNLWDADGHPYYNVRSGNLLAVLESSPDLNRKD